MLIYVIFAVVFAVIIVVELSLGYIWGIQRFGFERKFFKFKKVYDIPIQDFVPNNITALIFSIWSAAMCGIFLSLIWDFLPFTIPISVGGGILAEYARISIIRIYGMIRGIIPKEDKDGNTEQFDGLEGYVTVPTDGENIAKVMVEFNGAEYEKNAISLYHTPLDKYARVIIIHCTDGCFFVTTLGELYSEPDY
ncbi:MAG: hypothetical protein LBN42_04655 [Oscillospiraceae bacterium]|nr:hypothetical protein [Oscillospiraceae bacterium]